MQVCEDRAGMRRVARACEDLCEHAKGIASMRVCLVAAYTLPACDPIRLFASVCEHIKAFVDIWGLSRASTPPFRLFSLQDKIFLKKYLRRTGIVGNITELSDAGAKDNNTGC
ncbi:hypothetical protein DMP07_01610 [Slackia faecicanis]|uniref:Uncharacterized protein n=1 Tax=Slackia faecicanis TaxID=255723 RepID=A0A3N0AHM8_9ACTN|nr:hypothetical protein DMP07_01610 [Slackia faecicanis]